MYLVCIQNWASERTTTPTMGRCSIQFQFPHVLAQCAISLYVSSYLSLLLLCLCLYLCLLLVVCLHCVNNFVMRQADGDKKRLRNMCRQFVSESAPPPFLPPSLISSIFILRSSSSAVCSLQSTVSSQVQRNIAAEMLMTRRVAIATPKTGPAL